MQQIASNEKIAEVVIRSFNLLGFSADAYPAFSPQQITTSSFDRTNEKLLLCLLHFLLNKLDVSFSTSVSSCWPYNDTKEKNEFKRIVTISIDRISSTNSSASYSDFRTSLLSVAKGSAVWSLLKRLSDAVFDISIRSLVKTNQSQTTVAMSLQQSAGLWSTLASTDAEEITTAIRFEHACTIREGMHCTRRQNDQIEYSCDLEKRLKLAAKSISDATASMTQISQSESVHFLTESAQIERSELVLRVKEMHAALKQLAESSSFADCDSVASFYSDESRAKAVSLTEESQPACKLSNLETSALNFRSANIREYADEFGSTGWSSDSPIWHLDALSLEPLITFMEEYCREKDAKTEDGKQDGPSCPLGGDADAKALKNVTDRTNKILAEMQSLKIESEKLCSYIYSAIELV